MYDLAYHRASQSLDNVINTFFIPILTGRNKVTEGESFLPSLHIQEALTFAHHEKLPLCLKKTTALLVAHILQQSFQSDNIHTEQQICKGRGGEIMKQQQFHHWTIRHHNSKRLPYEYTGAKHWARCISWLSAIQSRSPMWGCLLDALCMSYN